MHTAIGHRYSLLAVVGAAFFVFAPIGTWLSVRAVTAPSEVATLDVAIADTPVVDVPVPMPEPDAAPAFDAHLLLQQVHIVPAFEGGRAVGFKVFGVRPGSDVERAGIENGDVITRLNGIALTSPERAIEAYERARDGLIVVDFVRRGQPGTITHLVPVVSQ